MQHKTWTSPVTEKGLCKKDVIPKRSDSATAFLDIVPIWTLEILNPVSEHDIYQLVDVIDDIVLNNTSFHRR